MAQINGVVKLVGMEFDDVGKNPTWVVETSWERANGVWVSATTRLPVLDETPNETEIRLTQAAIAAALVDGVALPAGQIRITTNIIRGHVT